MAVDSHTVTLLAGPKILGFFFNWALLGILNVQVYLYHINFPRDRLILQCLVYGILVFEWVQTGLLTGVAFEIFVYHYGDVNSLTTIYDAWFLVDVMCAIVSFTVQTFFAWRIYKLSSSRIIPGGIILLSLVQATAGIVLGAKLKNVSSTADVSSSRSVVITMLIWIIGSVVVDVVIATVMMIMMLKRKTGVAHTDMMINRIIRLVVETGTLTATFAILTLVLCLAVPGTLYYETVIYVLTKLYANTFLTNLVNRAFLRQRDVEDISIGAIHFASAQRGTLTGSDDSQYAAHGAVDSTAVLRVQKSYSLPEIKTDDSGTLRND